MLSNWDALTCTDYVTVSAPSQLANYCLTGSVYSTSESFAYVYDAVGNRTLMTSTTPLSGTVVTTYTYDAANRLTDRQVSDGRSYTYDWSDRNQMLTEWTAGVPVRTFTYDSAGRMTQATVFTLTTRFTYNGDGARRVVEAMGQGVTTYTVDYAAGNRILAETTPTRTVMYLYGHDCLGEFRDDEWLYYLNDGTGYVRQGADEQGQVTSRWLFDPDGTVLEGPQGPVSHLICGGVYDWSTGLIFKGGRYFDPSLGIWLALTPLVVLQSWRGRKRKRRGMPWFVVLLLVMGVGGMLAGCGGVTPPPGGDTDTSLCTDEAGLKQITVTLPQPVMDENAGENPQYRPGEWYVQLGTLKYPEGVVIVDGEANVPQCSVDQYLEFVQNVSPKLVMTFEDGTRTGYVGGGWYVDGDIPYETWPPDAPGQFDVPCPSGGTCVRRMIDAPGSSLLFVNAHGSPLIQYEREDKFRTYLTWRVPGVDRLPIGVVEWGWRVVAQKYTTDAGGIEWRFVHTPLTDPEPGQVKSGISTIEDWGEGAIFITDEPVYSPRLSDIVLENLGPAPTPTPL